MNEQRSLLEHLSVELLYLIFEYLAPHELLLTFQNLNQRFTAILAQQSLCLPNNRRMKFGLYIHYISLLPNYVSQVNYLHLSERRAPHAVNWFVSEMPLDKLTWPALKAVTIEDVPCHILESLLYDSALLSHVHSLSIDIGHRRYHHSEYNEFTDFNILIPVLNCLPELRSLYLRITTPSFINYASKFDELCPSITIHRNLHTLKIVQCSRELLVKLLSNGHLLQLRRLRVVISSTHAAMVIDPPYSTPLKQTSVPELRYISIDLFVGVAWLLSYFKDLQCHSQIEQFNITGHVRFTRNSTFPRVTELHQWLTLTKLREFKFQLKLSTDYELDAVDVRETVVAEYKKVTGDNSPEQYGNINVSYPAMSFSHPMAMNDSESEDEESSSISDSEEEGSNNTTRSSDVIQDEPIDDNVEEMEIVDLDYVRDEQLKSMQAVRRWHRLRKITIEGDYPDENDIVGENISHLLHIAQRSPHFRELYIDADLDFGRILSLNVELGILLISQLEVLYFTAKDSNCSLGDLVRIVDTLFSHSSSASPVLKQLTLYVDGHPSQWLSAHHLVDEIGKIMDRLPALIHFTLYCVPNPAFEERIYNLSELAPEWYVRSLLSRPTMNGQLNYRHKPNSLDIWL